MVANDGRLVRVLFAGFLTVSCTTLAAGCGGSRHYTLAATEQCLATVPGSFSYAEEEADDVGKAAAEGGVGIQFRNNTVTLGFERNGSDAQDDVTDARGSGGSTDAKLHSAANVYVSWDSAPSAGQKHTVEGCLRTGNARRVRYRYGPWVVKPFLASCESDARSGGATAATAKVYCTCLVKGLQARWPAKAIDRIPLAQGRALIRRCKHQATQS